MSNEQKKAENKIPGTFYPADKIELESVVDGFLNQAKIPEIKEKIRALIVPHAGYEYSGQVAAYGYKAIIGKKFKRVIIIGNSHQEYFDGISVYTQGFFETPLGKIEIDEKFAKKLLNKDKNIYFKESVHINEHSLQVQLPFLQKVLKNFQIIPILLGNNHKAVDVLIDVLKKLVDDKTLVIASSDLSHYPNYKDAQYSDNKVIQAILSGERDNFKNTILDLEKQGIDNLQTCACGADSIEVVMGLFGNKDIKLLNAANSGDLPAGRQGITGTDKSFVVGYASIVFTDSKLLAIAKQAVETYVKERKIIKIQETDENLNKHRGAFVTLTKNGQLRGCIGTFESNKSPYQTVIEMAICAAINDPRFNPVSKDELEDLDYEISVLSPLQKVKSWEDVEVGKHGVEIVKNGRKGVFLPQVATENNWDKETFLSILCTEKAGLPADCYKDKNTEIYIFTARVFKEE